jgi:hypothetical protein
MKAIKYAFDLVLVRYLILRRLISTAYNYRTISNEFSRYKFTVEKSYKIQSNSIQIIRNSLPSKLTEEVIDLWNKSANYEEFALNLRKKKINFKSVGVHYFDVLIGGFHYYVPKRPVKHGEIFDHYCTASINVSETVVSISTLALVTKEYKNIVLGLVHTQ